MGGQTERVWTIMEFLQKNSRAIIIALLAAGVVVAISASGDNSNNEQTVTEGSSEVTSADVSEGPVAPATDEASEEAVSNEANGTKALSDVQRNEDDFAVVATAGDNQTVLIRRVIAQYESENDVQLSDTQRLYTETNLVDDIGQSELITVGTEVKLSGADINVRVEEARNLSAQTLALWAQYL
jgi:predicted DNA binding protein